MTTYGVTSTGFVRKPVDVILEEIETRLKTLLGDNLNLLPTSIFGQIIGVFADRESEIWQLHQELYASQYPNSATGQALDNLCALTGVQRLQASKSTVTLRCGLDAGVTLPVGRIVSQGAGSTVRFVTTAAVTSVGAGTYDVAAECEVTGPIAALANTLTTIETPVTGWLAVTNLLDAVPGRDRETDVDLRIRRETSLTSGGSATTSAIRADVLAVDDVTSCTVYENTTQYTDADGVPRNSIEVVVTGGTTADVAEAIYGAVSAGVGTHGTTTTTVTDSEGFTKTVKFTRPVTVNIYVAITISVDVDLYPVDGDTQIKAAIVAHGDALGVGGDVVTSALYPRIFAVPGVLDVSEILVGTVNPPVASANIAIGSRQLSDFDTSRITITKV